MISSNNAINIKKVKKVIGGYSGGYIRSYSNGCIRGYIDEVTMIDDFKIVYEGDKAVCEGDKVIIIR